MPEFWVTYWSAHPEDEDACNTGFNFDNVEDAWKMFHDNDPRYTSGRRILHWRYVMIDGEGVNSIRSNPIFNDPDVRRSHALDERAERSEFAMQAGMAYGVNAYNEAMGYDLGSEDY